MKGQVFYRKEEVIDLLTKYVPLVGNDRDDIKITNVDINEFRSNDEYLRIQYQACKSSEDAVEQVHAIPLAYAEPVAVPEPSPTKETTHPHDNFPL